MTTIAVVGGGITGLAAAHELHRSRPDAAVVLFEASDRLGGKLHTIDFAACPVDTGADAFLARVPWGVDLCVELGLANELVAPAARSAYVLVDGALLPLPDPHILGVPVDLDAARRTGILTPAGVARAAVDLHGAAAALDSSEDPSVGDFVRARLGDEVADRLVGPLVGGINAGDPDRLSLRATAPQLAAGAAQGGSLIAGLQAAAGRPTADPGAPVFHSFAAGMGRLAAEVATESRADVRLGTTVEEIVPARRAGWELTTSAGRVTVDGVILAVPAFVAASLLRTLSPTSAGLLGAVEYASVAMVLLAFDPTQVGRPLDASGFLVPRREGLLMTACSWASSKWSHLGGGPVIVRVSAGRHGDERALDLDDDTLVESVVDELSRTMEVSGAPLEARVARWPRSFPQYAPGHLDRVAASEDALARDSPTLAVTGAAHRGLGIPACIRQGRESALRVLASLAA